MGGLRDCGQCNWDRVRNEKQMNNGATIDKDSQRETAHVSGSGFGGAAASGWGAHREADSLKRTRLQREIA